MSDFTDIPIAFTVADGQIRATDALLDRAMALYVTTAMRYIDDHLGEENDKVHAVKAGLQAVIDGAVMTWFASVALPWEATMDGVSPEVERAERVRKYALAWRDWWAGNDGSPDIIINPADLERSFAR